MTYETTHRRKNALLFTGVLFMLSLLGFGCRGGGKVVESLPQIDLQYWTVWDMPEDYSDMILAYREQHPNVRIAVRKFAFDEYEQALIEGWAKGEGPDIFSMPNASVGKYVDFVHPLPSSISLPTLSVSGGCSKSIRVVNQPKSTIVPEKLDDIFVPVVGDDVVFNNQIYGLPLASDTLALFYNKDLLNAAKIVSPPRTWQEFVDMVDNSKSTLTKEERGEIVQAGAALGTAENVNRSVDILSALMMQSGAQMIGPDGKTITFHAKSTTDSEFNPGVSATNFYTSFANPARVTYTWNASMPDAQEAFAAGKVGFFVGYSYQVAAIRLQNPQLNFGLAPLPQISLSGPEINYANYWVESVAQQSKNPNEAWDFVLFATTNQTQNKAYLAKTKKPTALKAQITEQKDDLDLGVFANELLTAKSWYHGADPNGMEQIMKDLVTAVNDGKDTEESLNTAALQVQQSYRKKE